MRRTSIAGAVLLLFIPAVSAGEQLDPAHGRTEQSRTLTFEDRVAAQRAIELVRWNHRTWPEDNSAPKPSLSTVLPDSAIHAKVEDYLKKSNALEKWWQRPITAQQLQAELDRMSTNTQDAQTLREIYLALGDDPFAIAEILARQTLADRLTRSMYANDERFHAKASFDAWWAVERGATAARVPTPSAPYRLLSPVQKPCANDTWTSISTDMSPTGRASHTAVWTGAEMIIWGGGNRDHQVNTGGRYDPSTDTWTATSTGENVPVARDYHTAIWTGSEMIVWGGTQHGSNPNNLAYLNTGGRYNPSADTWTPTSTSAGVPLARGFHFGAWTGSEMIVWGGRNPYWLNTGGRYDPSTDTWTATSTGANVPAPRSTPSAVWTGTEMIIWGGFNGRGPFTNTGGRYNPFTDSWLPTSTGPNVPTPRQLHTALWTGAEMIVLGGHDFYDVMNTGGRYDPSTDAWTAISPASNVRYCHTALWTGEEMIVWGGTDINIDLNSGERYNPSVDIWTVTSRAPNVPQGRMAHTAVWTGREMLVWGGAFRADYLDTGGRYCACPDGRLVYHDADGDGYGDPLGSLAWCGESPPSGYVAVGGDCNDSDPSVHPGAAEACNGIDDNCNGQIDEGLSRVVGHVRVVCAPKAGKLEVK